MRDILAHHVLGLTTALLDPAFELFALAVDLIRIIIRELAPLLFYFSLCLLPIPSM